MTKRFLNLGCGDRFHPDWENVDLYPAGPGVRACDLRQKTPYADETFDVVYHSHVLEHFPREFGLPFLQECNRLLKREGVVRVAVPDLEQIARLYLEALQKARSGEPGWAENHEWMIMELYDQCVRDGPYGAFIEYFRRSPIRNWDFVLQRWGKYASIYREGVRELDTTGVSASSSASPSVNGGRAWGYIFRNPGTLLRNKLFNMLIKKADLEAIQVGRYRQTGALHKWMYDSQSLGNLLQKAGFAEVKKVGPKESRIPGWAGFNLDSDADGCVYKADSMYVEAIKP
jgi:hypothetical protein